MTKDSDQGHIDPPSGAVESGSDQEPCAYEVGYGEPPVATRFPKGRYGNPKGRKKKAPGTAALGDHLHIGRVHLEVSWDPDRPGQFACCECLAEWSAHPITGVRQHSAKAHTGRDGTVDLHQRQLRLRARRSIFGRNTRALQPGPIARPTLGQKQP